MSDDDYIRESRDEKDRMIELATYNESKARVNETIRKCSKGHKLHPFEVNWFRLRNKKYCLKCIEEKITPILEEIGIGIPLEIKNEKNK